MIPFRKLRREDSTSLSNSWSIESAPRPHPGLGPYLTRAECTVTWIRVVAFNPRRCIRCTWFALGPFKSAVSEKPTTVEG